MSGHAAVREFVIQQTPAYTSIDRASEASQGSGAQISQMHDVDDVTMRHVMFPPTGARDNDGMRHLWFIYLQEARRGDNCHVRRAQTPRRWAWRRRSATLTSDAEETACCSDYRHSRASCSSSISCSTVPSPITSSSSEF